MHSNFITQLLFNHTSLEINRKLSSALLRNFYSGYNSICSDATITSKLVVII